MRSFSDEQGRTRVFVEAYRSYSADGLFTSRRRYLLKPPGANPRRTPLIGREALLGNKRAIYGWKLAKINTRDLVPQPLDP
jgi:hypothetical protein